MSPVRVVLHGEDEREATIARALLTTLLQRLGLEAKVEIDGDEAGAAAVVHLARKRSRKKLAPNHHRLVLSHPLTRLGGIPLARADFLAVGEAILRAHAETPQVQSTPNGCVCHKLPEPARPCITCRAREERAQDEHRCRRCGVGLLRVEDARGTCTECDVEENGW